MRRLFSLLGLVVWTGLAGSALAQDGAPAPPLVTSPVPLAAPDPQASAGFGSAMALDGTTALVGAPGVAGGVGVAYVLVWDGSGWIEQAAIPNPAAESNAAFGHAVALSGDTALVGAPYADVAGYSDVGAAYVFTRSGATWSLQAALTASDFDDTDQFGWAVALDGDTAAIGAPHRDLAPLVDCGAAYVFTRSGAAWSETAILQAEAPSQDAKFGFALALEGDRLAIGENQAEGAVTMFARAGAMWSRQSTVHPVSAYGQKDFGAAVALDGDTMVVGAPGDQRYFEGSWLIDAGAAYVFVWDGAVWQQQARLQPAVSAWEDAYKAGFGGSLSLAEDTLIVGADARAAPGSQGAAHLFARSEDQWSEDVRLTWPETAVKFGAAVGVAGGRLLVGAPAADLHGGADAGVVAAYRITPGIALALAAAHAPPEPVAGQRLDLIFTVANAGPDRAAGIHLDVTLPAALLFESAATSQGSGCAASGGDVVCALDALAPGGEATVTIKAILGPDTFGTSFSVQASVAAQEPDLNPANNAVLHLISAAPFSVPPGCLPTAEGVVICTTH